MSDLQATLAGMASAGDSWAWFELNRQYKRFISKIANEFSRRCKSLDRDDIRQEASICLLHLCTLYKPDSGAKFSSYCISWLPLLLQRRVDSIDRVVPLPIKKSVEHRRVLREGGDSIGTSMVDSDQVMGIGDPDGETRVLGAVDMDILRESDVAYKSALNSELMRNVSRLEPRMQKVLTMHLIDETDFGTIGREIGLSKQGAINLYDRAIEQLRMRMGVRADLPMLPRTKPRNMGNSRSQA